MFFHFGDFGLISGLPLVRAGYIAVDFFFVLSGFVIAAAYGERLAHGFSRATFMFLRFGRLYPLHIAVIAGFAAAKLLSGRSLFEGSHGAGYLLRAVLLLDGYIPNDPNFYNQAAWSISVELAAYLAAALLFGRRRYGIAAAVAIWLVSLAGYVAGIDAPVFGEMLQRCLVGFGLGVLCLGLYRRLALPQAIRLWSAVEAMVLVLAAALMALLRIEGWRLLACDLSFAVAIVVFAHERGWLSRVLRTAPMRALGEWSYSIYMVHLLVSATVSQSLLRIVAWLGRDDLVRPGSGHPGFETLDFGFWPNTLVSVIVAAICIALASQTYRLIEEPGRRWAKRKARRRGAPGAEATAPTL